MAYEKLVIGANKITKVIYINTNVKAKGGRRKKIKHYIDDRKSDYTYDAAYHKTYEKQIEVGKYHVKNYKQRNQIRGKIIKELIENNFQAPYCSMITLSFKGCVERNDLNDPFSEIDDEHPLKIAFNQLKQIEFESISYISNSLFANVKENNEDISDNKDNINCKDLESCNQYFKKFVKKMQYRYENFLHVTVMSKQVNGNWHYHMVANIDYIDFNELKKIWRVGGVYIGKIKSDIDLKKVNNYLIKNMYSVRLDLKGKSGYIASRNLQKNKCLRSWLETEKAEFNEQNKRIENRNPDDRHETKHSYSAWTRDDEIFQEEKKIECTNIYLDYNISSKEMFKDTVIAKLKK